MARSILIPTLLLIGALSGCTRIQDGLPRPDLSNRKARIMATTGMIADLAHEVGGDLVEVECLLGPGGDPHKYYPTPSDMAKFDKADLILYNGLELEAKMGEIFESKSKRIRTVPVSKLIDKSELRSAEENQNEPDPHIWFDVQLWMKAVTAVRDALTELDPAHASTYENRAEAYRQKLNGLDREIRAEIAKIHEEKRVLITAHDAFGYFGRAYGIEVKGLQGTSTATQAGTHSVQDLVHIIGTRRIPVIFAETSVPDEGIKAVLEAVGKQYKDVKVSLSDERLFSDALGEPGTPEGTYIGMVRHNVRVMVNALSK